MTITLMVSCSKAPGTDDAEDDVKALNYRIANKTEGAGLMLSNDAYFDGMTQNDLDFRTQKTGATSDEYKTFAGEQVLDFTDEQKAIIDKHMEHHNSFATFVINDKNIDCFTAFVTTRHFEKEGDNFFDLGTTALVPVDGTDIFYTIEDTLKKS